MKSLSATAPYKINHKIKFLNSVLFPAFTFICLALIPAASVADETDAGCGLGYLAWKDKEGKVSQLLAATTNMSFGSQTFGISSGTSGCTSETWLSSKYLPAQRFFIANENFILRDIAVGSGQHLAAYANLLRCSKLPDLNSDTRQRSVDQMTLSKDTKINFIYTAHWIQSQCI